MPRHHHVVGLGDHLVGVSPRRFAVYLLHPAAKSHRKGDVGTREFPGCAVLQPGLGLFDLPPVLDFLREHAVFVADAVTERGQGVGGHGIQETGCQSPQAAVAKCRIGFRGGYVFQRACVRLQPSTGGGGAAQRCQRIRQTAPDQELHRQIDHAPRLGRAFPILRQYPAFCQLRTQHLGQRLHGLCRAGTRSIDRHRAQQMRVDGVRQTGGGTGGGWGHHGVLRYAIRRVWMTRTGEKPGFSHAVTCA